MKTKWPTIECTTCQMLISPAKCGLQTLWRVTCTSSLLVMAYRPTLCVKDIGKVQNWWMAKPWIVLSLLVFLLVKSLFHDDSVLIVDTTVYFTWTNCACMLARYKMYKLMGMTHLPIWIFKHILTWHWSFISSQQTTKLWELPFLLCVVTLFAYALCVCTLGWCLSIIFLPCIVMLFADVQSSVDIYGICWCTMRL